MENTHSIAYSVVMGVATVTLDRPESMNSLNAGLRKELSQALDQSINDESVKTIVIASNGRCFCSGTDLNEAQETDDTYGMLEEEYKPLLNAIMSSPKPVIAAVNGACAGIGASLALSCDLIMMSEDAYIYLAFAKVGLIPDGGLCWHLARNIGYKRSFEVIAEAGKLDASYCKSLGLVNKIVPKERLRDDCIEWAMEIAKSAPLALRYSKQALQQAMRLDLNDTMQLEASLQSICAASEDSREGVRAFMDKRQPVFTGK